MKTILTPVDFSDVTDRVVEESARLAQAFGGCVVLLHVARGPSALPHYASEMANLAAARNAIEAGADRNLEALKDRLRQSGVATQTLRLTGEPKRDIIEQAEKLSAGYIVMGSHGHTALHDLVLGSTTSAVIKRTRRVVVVVPALKPAARDRDAGRANRPDAAAEPAAGHRAMKTILAAVDFSPVTKRVMTQALALARGTGARLVLLNVTSPASLVRDHAAFETLIRGKDPASRRGATPAAVRAVHGDSLQIIGKPTDVILEQAARCGADYIVMGSRGHTMLFEVTVGGTAAGVLKGARCPVLLVPTIKRSVRRRGASRIRRPKVRPQRASGRAGAFGKARAEIIR